MEKIFTFTERMEIYKTKNQEILDKKSKELGYEVEFCGYCDGEGGVIWSCCGDDITFNIDETDLCPSCGEHCGDEETLCEECKGSGFIKKLKCG